VQRFGLWLDTQTKAHRGDRLARLAVTVPAGEREGAHAPPQVTLAHPAKVPPGASLDHAWRAGLESCLAHLSANMSELATLPSGVSAVGAFIELYPDDPSSPATATIRFALLREGQTAPVREEDATESSTTAGLTAAIDIPTRGPVGIYRNTMMLGAVDALADNYPVVRRLVGDEMFEAMAVDHATCRPPRSPVIAPENREYWSSLSVPTHPAWAADTAQGPPG